MEFNHPNNPPSSSADDDYDPLPDPHDSVHQSPADEVSFDFNHLQIHDNNDNDDNDDNNDSISNELIPESSESDEEDDAEDGDGDGDGDDFTFASVGDNDLLTDEVFEDGGQIRRAFPLFDQSLLTGDDLTDSGDVKRRLPIDVPVDKVFIESPRRSLSEYGETDGTVQALQSESSEINMKSNSTGFSKLWRFRNEMNRSNSDGRDAFVFLESPDTAAAAASTSEAKQKGVSTAVGGGGKGKVVQKVKRSKASAHEVYLKQKGQTEEERRRSYLPYRPGLMGFFTNVNGGLSKNVHPF